MKESKGCIRTNYNAQTSVDEENQFIVACDLITECNDKKKLIQLVKQSEENLKNNVDICKADSGYHSGANLAKMSEISVEALIDDSNKQRVDNENFKFHKIKFTYNLKTDSYTCPEGKELHLILATEEKKFISAKNAWSALQNQNVQKKPTIESYPEENMNI